MTGRAHHRRLGHAVTQRLRRYRLRGIAEQDALRLVAESFGMPPARWTLREIERLIFCEWMARNGRIGS